MKDRIPKYLFVGHYEWEENRISCEEETILFAAKAFHRLPHSDRGIQRKDQEVTLHD